MKKNPFYLIILIGVTFILSCCGPSAEEKIRIEKTLTVMFGNNWGDSCKYYSLDGSKFSFDVDNNFLYKGKIFRTYNFTPAAPNVSPRNTTRQAGRDNNIQWPNLSYSSSLLGLPAGVVVKWNYRNPTEDWTRQTFPTDVKIYIRGANGITTISDCSFDVWDQLQTGDTLR